MTLHERLKEIQATIFTNCGECGPIVPTGTLSDSTITAIIAAVMERLPGEMPCPDLPVSLGWNAYRQEVLKVLELPSTTL